MAYIKTISKPGDYNNIIIRGNNRNNDIGLLIDVWGNDPVFITDMEITKPKISLYSSQSASMTNLQR